MSGVLKFSHAGAGGDRQDPLRVAAPFHSDDQLHDICGCEGTGRVCFSEFCRILCIGVLHDALQYDYQVR